MAADHNNSDGVRRQSRDVSYADIICAPDMYEPDDALKGYYDTPRPANDNTKTYRSARSSRPKHCYNSTSFKYVDVALARASMIDGPLAAGAYGRVA